MTIDKLNVRKVDARVVVEGKTTPNTEVVVENKSIAVFAPVDTPDTYVKAKAAADGTFAVTLPAAREGDRVVVKSGANVASLRIANIETVDGRPPVVRQQGLRLVASGGPPGSGTPGLVPGDVNASFGFAQVCRSQMVGEPGQLLRMTNVRTKESITFTLDAEGRLPDDAKLGGKAGDAWQLATTDGAHNTNFSDGCGLLVAPSPKGTEPAAASSASKSLTALDAPLFVGGGPSAKSIKQGEIGDCWFVSVADMIATMKPQRLRDMMKDNGDGTVTVTFKRYDHAGGKYVDESVTVTRKVYSAYGKSLNNEAWFPLLEKAYAQWKGGYDGIKSGYPFEAFEALLGVEGRHFDFDVSSADAVWSALKRGTKNSDAMVAWSRVDSRELPFSNSGLVGDHAYGIMGVEERGGERVVRLRNPWSSNPWSGSMTKLEAGVLELNLDTFMKYFAGYGSAST